MPPQVLPLSHEELVEAKAIEQAAQPERPWHSNAHDGVIWRVEVVPVQVPVCCGRPGDECCGEPVAGVDYEQEQVKVGDCDSPETAALIVNAVNNYPRAIATIEALQAEVPQPLSDFITLRDGNGIPHRRCWDLLRQMRGHLSAENLIDSYEYAWLCAGGPEKSPAGGGSPCPRRLETYDQHAARLKEAEAQLDTQAQELARVRADRDGILETSRLETIDRLELSKALNELRADRDRLAGEVASLRIAVVEEGGFIQLERKRRERVEAAAQALVEKLNDGVLNAAVAAVVAKGDLSELAALRALLPKEGE